MEAVDTKMERTVAIKVIRNKTSSRKAAKREIMISRYIARRDPDNTSLCAKIIEEFLHNEHI